MAVTVRPRALLRDAAELFAERGPVPWRVMLWPSKNPGDYR
jgi:hypothetical protein